MDNIMIAATQNKGKLKELRLITEKYGQQLISMAEAGLGDLDIEENGETFAENSYIKASTVANLTGKPCIADDSGLCVDVLGGAPGIHSARYSGVHGDDQANRTKLLADLKDVPMEQRTAHFPEAVVAKEFQYTAWLGKADAIIDVCKLKTHGKRRPESRRTT